MKAQAVICGGGLTGLSVAYHLAKRNILVYLFEKECIGSYVSLHGSIGAVSAPMFYADTTLQKIARDTHNMYHEITSGGTKSRFTPCERVYFSKTSATTVDLQRLLTRLNCAGSISGELLTSKEEMLSKWPMINCNDIECALISYGNAIVDVNSICQKLASAAQNLGVKIFESSTVKNVLCNNHQVYAVDTSKGLIETSNFVNTAGIWSNSIPVKGISEENIKLAAHPCISTCLSTENLPNYIDEKTPFFIDCDEHLFIYPTTSKTYCEGFMEGDLIPLNSSAYNSLPSWIWSSADWDHFYPILKRLLNRCPALENLQHVHLHNNMEMYTPDMFPIVGQISQVCGYFVCNGLNGQGTTLAGGLGKLLAEWILTGHPGKIDVSKIDVTRFLSLHQNPQYLIERVAEVSSNIIKTLLITHQCRSARNLRMSTIYYQLKAAGAIFGEIMGYERPLWYDKSEKNIQNQLYIGQDNTKGRPQWFGCVMREYEACRERIGLFDMTSFSKFNVYGNDVITLLQKLCSNNIDKPIGTTIYTGMQNENGGYVADCTLSRTDENNYFIIAPTIQQVRLANWLKFWINQLNMDVIVEDVTAAYTALNIVGPSSRNLMQDVTGKSASSTEFPQFSYRKLDVGMAAGIQAISVTHCGELGWVLYIPNEVAQNVYEKIVTAGQEYNLQHAGYYALRHLRIEKFYVYWGQDISNSITPIECGRSFRVNFNKDFIGKEALLKQLEYGVSKRFVQLLVDKHNMDIDPWPQGNEPIFRNNELSGWTTSASYGFTLGTQVCLGYIENKDFGVSQTYLTNGSYQIEIAGKRFPVRLNLHSPTLPMISSEHPSHYRPTQG